MSECEGQTSMIHGGLTLQRPGLKESAEPLVMITVSWVIKVIWSLEPWVILCDCMRCQTVRVGSLCLQQCPKLFLNHGQKNMVAKNVGLQKTTFGVMKYNLSLPCSTADEVAWGLNTQVKARQQDTGETKQGRTDNKDWWETQQRK